jgi:hypothetical protein
VIYVFYYIIISYLVGFVIFTVESYTAIKKGQYHLFQIGIVLLVASPLVAWHGVLHYVQLAWAKVNKQRTKYWI